MKSGDKHLQRLQMEVLTPEQRAEEEEGRTSRGGGCTHMRLLGGILRPSRYQVTCGCGKLRMRGAGTTAPSPWETDWTRSPSSKLPMTAGGHRREGGVRKRGAGGCHGAHSGG